MTEKAESSKEGGTTERRHQETPSNSSHLQASEKEDAEAHMRCTSCGVKIEAEDKWVKFSCPRCNKQKIIRCDKCKRLMNHYECKKCGFIGP